MAADTPENSENAPPGETDVLAAAQRISLWGYFVLCLKNCTTFRGRARRREFWAFALFSGLFLAVVFILCDVYYSGNIRVRAIFTLIFALPGAAVLVRRLHDTGKSGWYILISAAGIIVPPLLVIRFNILNLNSSGAYFVIGTFMLVSFVVAAPVVMLSWLCRDSEPEANKYGSNPKENDWLRLEPAIKHVRRKFNWRMVPAKPAVAIPALLIIAVLANWLYIEITRVPAPVPPGTPDTRWYETNSRASVFTISTADELAGLAAIVNGTWGGNPASDDFADKTINLAADIDLSRYGNWVPIGNFAGEADKGFKGRFDGRGYVIRNLSIYRPFADFQGLFGIVHFGRVVVLGLENVNIAGGSRVGAVAGRVTAHSSVINCYSTGTVSGADVVGGLIGDVGVYSNVGHCYSSAAVNGMSKVGGVAGVVTRSQLANCYSAGAVRGTEMVGGVAAEASNWSAMRNCAALNPEVRGNGGYVCRVLSDNVGEMLEVNAAYENNAAYDQMIINGDCELRIDYTSNEFLDGAGITAEEIRADGTIGGRFTAKGKWTTANGKLPGLFGRTVEMPEHLR